MAWQKVNRAIGGITPLGVFTITPGTPQNILANTSLESTRYSFQCRQLGVSVDSGAGSVYVNYGNIPGRGDQTVLILQGGQQQSIPIGARVTDGLIDATQYFLDASNGSSLTVSVYAMDATN